MAAPRLGRISRSVEPPLGPSTIPLDFSKAVRRFGTTGALLMALGALGAGALPVPNPLFGLRVLSLPPRTVTLSIAVTYAGMAMLVLAWLWLGRLLRRGPEGPGLPVGQLTRTIALWALPLALAPPMFSRDVYSYIAQSAIASRGLDPYTVGPGPALGLDDPLTLSIPTIWRDTPAPYGPLFLMLGRMITGLTGDDVVAAVFAHRFLAVVGLGLMVWALPRLARRFGVDPSAALWLGAANPLVLFHLVSGAHTEALMLGLMLVGLELGLSRSWLLGAIVITLSAAVKLPSVLALGFLGMHMAREWGGRPRDVAKATGLLGGIAVSVLALLGLVSGLGFGWLGTLGTANLIRSWMSLTTDLGQLGGGIGIVAGLGDHTDQVLALTRAIGGTVAAAVVLWLLLATLRGRVDPLTGLGMGLGAVVLLGPVVHPWYLLWAAIPLAATAGWPRYRRAAVGASAIIALLVPPTGADFAFRSFQLPLAIVAAAVILIVALAFVYRLIPAPRPPVVSHLDSPA